MKITGHIVFIDPAKKVGEKDFTTRSFGVVTRTELNAQIYQNHFGFQFQNNQCALLDNINIEDEVEVDFSIRGNLNTKADLPATEKNPNKNVIYVNLTAVSIKVIKPASAQVPAAQAPAQSGAPEPFDPNGGVKDDLPF